MMLALRAVFVMADVLDATRGMPHMHWHQEVLFCLLEDANFKALTCDSLAGVPTLIEVVIHLEGALPRDQES